MLQIELPFPPSVNHYFRNFRGRMVISEAGRAFRRSVCILLRQAGVRPMTGPLAVAVDLYPPDHRRRDVDNAQKSLLDALQHGGAFFDDSQVIWLLTVKAAIVPPGKTVVWIGRLGIDPPPACSAASFPTHLLN